MLNKNTVDKKQKTCKFLGQDRTKTEFKIFCCPAAIFAYVFSCTVQAGFSLPYVICVNPELSCTVEMNVLCCIKINCLKCNLIKLIKTKLLKH